ncbi:hypothetical protein BT96DRAFT_822518, partial [Gymnopus androsaceus JB14]
LNLNRATVAKWNDISFFSINGIVSIVAALAWWREKIYSLQSDEHYEQQLKEKEVGKFEQAVVDVTYDFGELNKQ